MKSLVPVTRIALDLALLLAFGAPAAAIDAGQDPQEEPETKENQKKKRRILPIPVIITEPAIGYGLGDCIAGGGYMHRKPTNPDSTTAAPF